MGHDMVGRLMVSVSLLCATGVSQAQMPREFGNILNRAIQEAQKGQQPAAQPSATPSVPNVPAMRSGGTLPCLSKICLNDSITKHTESVKWRDYSMEANNALYEQASRQGEVVEIGEGPTKRANPAPATIKMVRKGRYEIGQYEDWTNNYVRGVSAADVEALLPYVILKKVDERFLRIVAEKRPIFCRAIKFTGSFQSESGYRTTVDASPNSETGELQIVSLVRDYPSRDRVQFENIQREVVKEFPFLQAQGGSINVAPPWGSGLASFSPSGELAFLLYVNDQGARFSDRALASQQPCGAGRASVN